MGCSRTLAASTRLSFSPILSSYGARGARPSPWRPMRALWRSAGSRRAERPTRGACAAARVRLAAAFEASRRTVQDALRITCSRTLPAGRTPRPAGEGPSRRHRARAARLPALIPDAGRATVCAGGPPRYSRRCSSPWGSWPSWRHSRRPRSVRRTSTRCAFTARGRSGRRSSRCRRCACATPTRSSRSSTTGLRRRRSAGVLSGRTWRARAGSRREGRGDVAAALPEGPGAPRRGAGGVRSHRGRRRHAAAPDRAAQARRADRAAGARAARHSPRVRAGRARRAVT